MELSEYQRLVESAKSSYTTLICGYCGEETLSRSARSFCSNCESIIGTGRSELASRNPQLVDSLDKIRSASASGDFDTVLYAYTELEKTSTAPQMLYCHGLAYVEYSNMFVSKIRYDLKGFMEQNARARDNGFKMLSEAKRLFAKSAYHSESASLEGNTSSDLIYNRFLCLLRIGELRRAKQAIDELATANEHALADYANLLLHIASSEYRAAAPLADKIARSENSPMNAFYYVAFLRFKAGKSGTPKMLSMLDGVIDPVKLHRLAESIALASNV